MYSSSHPQRWRHCLCTHRDRKSWNPAPIWALSHSASGLPLYCCVHVKRGDHTVEYVLITHGQRTSEYSLLAMHFRLLKSHTHFHGTCTRGSHIHIACRSICDQDQNGIKRSTLFFGADQGIKLNSEQLKSSDQEPRNGAIKWSRTIFTDQDSWSWPQTLLQAD